MKCIFCASTAGMSVPIVVNIDTLNDSVGDSVNSSRITDFAFISHDTQDKVLVTQLTS
jgi:hypothetical protein